MVGSDDAVEEIAHAAGSFRVLVYCNAPSTVVGSLAPASPPLRMTAGGLDYTEI